jgi:ABC-type glycerol-3-phosphate transport system permease component
VSEALFNFVLAWALLFLPVIATDGPSQKIQNKVKLEHLGADLHCGLAWQQGHSGGSNASLPVRMSVATGSGAHMG